MNNREPRQFILVHRHESEKKSWWDRIEQFAKIVSIVAVPVILGFGGWWIQDAVSRRSVNKDYVQLAISILTKSEKEIDPSLRAWAVKLLNQTSPIKFEKIVAKKLTEGEINLPPPPTSIRSPFQFFEPVRGLSPDDPLRAISSAVGRLEVVFAGNIYTCTAWLISKDLVFTADFCVIPRFADDKPSHVTLTLGYVSKDKPGDTYEIESVPVEVNRQHGYAILRVSGNAGDKYGKIPLKTRAPKKGEAVFIIHHPQGRPLSVSRKDCVILEEDGPNNEFKYLCDTAGGVSGAPVFGADDFMLLGIHYHGAQPGIDASRAGKRMDRIIAVSTALSSLLESNP